MIERIEDTGIRLVALTQLSGTSHVAISTLAAHRSYGAATADRHALRVLASDVRRALQIHMCRHQSVAVHGTLGRVIESKGVGIIYLNADGHVTAQSGLAKELLKSSGSVEVVESVFTTRHRRENARLSEAVKAACQADFTAGTPSCHAMTLSCWAAPVSLGILIVPVEPEAVAGNWPRTRALILVHDQNELPRVEPQRLRDTYGLTRSEANLAAGLACGATLQDEASRGGVSKETMRKHLRAIFSKLGVGRQSELVAKLHTSTASLGI
jgi:DNA-binding CsgD family transcriptional regulator